MWKNELEETLDDYFCHKYILEWDMLSIFPIGH